MEIELGLAEAIANAQLTGWKAILLIVSVVLIWNLPAILRERNTRFRMKREFEIAEKEADRKYNEKLEKKQRKLSKRKQGE